MQIMYGRACLKTTTTTIHGGRFNSLSKSLIQLIKFNSSTLFPSISTDDNYDHDYYKDLNNVHQICQNIRLRKIRHLEAAINSAADDTDRQKIILENIARMPNKLHSDWIKIAEAGEGDPNAQRKIMQIIGNKTKKFDFKPKKAETLLHKLGLYYSSDHHQGKLGFIGGSKSYSFVGDLVRLQQALTQWTMKELVNRFNFIPVVVPLLVYDHVIRSCGFEPEGKRTQVYSIDGKANANWKKMMSSSEPDRSISENSRNKICLIGTAEHPLAALHLGSKLDETSDLPKRYCAVSRCYRAEADENSADLYRVHYFTKVEMFALTTKKDSDSMLDSFVDIQKHLFSQLELHCNIIDMPPFELGLPASRKIDIEAWLPGRRAYGEISSASNCTDYQSRRFNIRYRTLCPNYDTNEPFKDEFVHTVNGTACAVPRMLIALIENNQEKSGSIKIPIVLRELMGQDKIDKPSNLFEK